MLGEGCSGKNMSCQVWPYATNEGCLVDCLFSFEPRSFCFDGTVAESGYSIQID